MTDTTTTEEALKITARALYVREIPLTGEKIKSCWARMRPAFPEIDDAASAVMLAAEIERNALLIQADAENYPATRERAANSG